MNEISDLLSIDCVDARLAAANKKALFQRAAAILARKTKVAAKDISASLVAREKLGSTGFGAGAAIPHGKVQGLKQVTGYFARLTAPIEFQALDGLPVDLVFLLLSPPDAGIEHLKALASVSRLLRDELLAAKLRGARSRDAIYALIAGAETRDAA